jgi:prepilin-type N-terminal cleavage/methylation domain-containing protein
MRQRRGFTLVEILIVVTILGVLAAIVIPAIANSATSARQTTLAMNIALLRRFIPVYQSQHFELSPGYPDGDQSAAPTEAAFVAQATMASTKEGETALRGTPGYPCGPYLSKIPANPFNQLETILMLGDSEAFPVTPDGKYGWIYRAASGEVRPGNSGSDGMGRPYYDY